jgi:hypothetical protein
MDAGGSRSVTVNGLDAGATYYFAISGYNAQHWESGVSDEVSGRVPFAPLIIFEPSSQTAQAGAAAVISVDVIGTPPLTLQWFDGATPVIGGTYSTLTLPRVSDGDAGSYTVVASNSGGSVTSAVATVTVVDSPSDLNTMTSAVGTVLRAGGKTPAAPSLAASMVSAAGIYNGLFYQTDDAGMPAMTVQTAGLVSNCVVDAQGNYTGAIYVGGLSNSIAGAFDADGNAGATVDRTAAGLSDLGVMLHLDLNVGELRMSGVVSNLDQGNPWTAVLTAELETNAFAQSPNFVLAIPPMNGLPGGSVIGLEAEGGVSLFGMLGDETMFSQNAPVSTDGSVPLFVQLNGQSGLLAGWVNAFGSPSTSVLTWICPSGQTGSGFTNIVEAAITPTFVPTP